MKKLVLALALAVTGMAAAQETPVVFTETTTYSVRPMTAQERQTMEDYRRTENQYMSTATTQERRMMEQYRMTEEERLRNMSLEQRRAYWEMRQNQTRNWSSMTSEQRNAYWDTRYFNQNGTTTYRTETQDRNLMDRSGFNWGGFGIKAGTNFSTISTDGYDETNAKMGFYAGIFYNAPLGNSGIRIQPELIYNNLGGEAKGRYITNNQPYTTALNLDYLTLPVMFQIQPMQHFYLEVGPSIGYLVNARTTTTNGANFANATIVRKELDTNDFNKWNLGVSGGLGANVSKHLGVNVRYTYGFSDLTSPDSDPNIKASNRNNNFQLGLNYKF